MTASEVRKIYHPTAAFWKRIPAPRMIILTLLGFVLGIVGTKFIDDAVAPLAIQRNSTSVVIWNGYLGVVIDRTRTSWCNAQPSRTISTTAVINGVTFPFVLPVTSQSLVWPELGRQKFILGIGRVSDIPPGVWNINSTERVQCHWYDAITGGQIIRNAPVSVTIPGAGLAR